jgi:UDP-N-acetyl-2-amino-2-deoxyglucuronate dehydrogenase
MTPTPRTFRIAIAGCGGIAAFHARAIADLPHAELVGACARSSGKAEKFCAEFGGSPFLELEAMLDATRPDVLCVTTPSGAHLEAVEAAAKRGIHIVCEKPLEISADRMSRLVAACDEGKVSLCAIFQQRMGPLMNILHRAVADGRFGEMPVIQASVPWWRDDAYYGAGRWQGTLALDGGGALMNQSIHAVDLVLWLAAASMKNLAPGENPVAEVSCFSGKFGHAGAHIEVEDTAVVNLRLKDGRAAQILASTAMYPGSLRRFLVGGRDGTAEILEDQLIQWQFREHGAHDADILARFGHKTGHGGGAGDPFALSHANHRENIGAFLQSLREGVPFPMDGRVARQAVEVILAAYRSAGRGGAVEKAG